MKRGASVYSVLAAPDPRGHDALAPQNSGVRRPIGSRFLGTTNTPAAGKIDITSAYTGKFGAPAVGARVFVQLNTNTDGYEGLRQTFSARVPDAS